MRNALEAFLGQVLPEDYEFCELGPQDKDEIFSTIADREWEGDHCKWDYLLRHGECFGLRHLEELIATAGLNRFGTEIAVLAMVLVKRDYEGRGLGSALTARCLRLAGESVCCLYSSDEGRPMYEKKFGFVEVGGSKTHVGCPRLAPQDMLSTHTQVREAHAEDWQGIVALDRAAKGGDREELLQHLHQDTAKLFVSYRDEELVGFVLEFQGHDSRVLGPLVAKEPRVARELLQELFRTRRETSPVTVLLNERFSELSNWLKEREMPAVERAPLMTLGGRPLPGRPHWQVAVPGYPWG